MHELGIVIQIVKQMENYMVEHQLSKIDTITLQIGALSSVYPKYVYDVYPIAVEKSKLRDTKLNIEITPGIGRCIDCGIAYSLIENKNLCPKCKSPGFEVLSGTEFLIKEIHAY